MNGNSPRGGTIEQNAIEEAETLLQSLQSRANQLITELKAFQLCLQEHGKHKEVEIRVFRKGVESEVKSIQTISKQQQTICQDHSMMVHEAEGRTSRYIHALKSSNLPFYEAVWHTARQSQGVTALEKRVYWNKVSHGTDFAKPSVNHVRKDAKASVIVDIVAEGGLEWTKVSTITEKRLLFEMAKEGWEFQNDSSDEDDFSGGDSPGHDSHDEHRLELVQIAYDLKSASHAQRIGFRHPKVRFVLPNIQEGHTKEIDDILGDIRSTGATIVSSRDFSSSDVETAFSGLDLNGLQSKLTQILPTSVAPLTSTLNIDCTVLLALISDISHVPRLQLPPCPTNRTGTYHIAIVRQIKTEETSPLLETELYQLLRTRRLVCTHLAVKRMREIVRTMGTPSELDRATVLFAEDSYSTQSPQELNLAFQRHSHYRVPEDLKLPIQIMNFDGTESELVQQPSMEISSAELDILRRIVRKWGTGPGIKTSLINRSVFAYGWYQSIVTVTSNKVVAAGLNRMINELLDMDEQSQIDQERNSGTHGNGVTHNKEIPSDSFVGPRMYVCDTARSLVGKEKQTRYDP